MSVLSSRRRQVDLLTLLAVAVFYSVNRLWLSGAADGWAGWFLTCYANDICAGAAILAWLDLLLSLGGRPPLRTLGAAILFLFACGLVWEVLAPLWKPGAVFDPWDLMAYQVGGLLWLAFFRRFLKSP